jgi:hypothetical protein
MKQINITETQLVRYTISRLLQKKLKEQVVYQNINILTESKGFDDEVTLEDDLIPIDIIQERLEKKFSAELYKESYGYYKGKKVKLNKPSRGDVKKFKVFVDSEKKDSEGRKKAIKVNFGHGGSSAKNKGEKTMRINRQHKSSRENFLKRHNCSTANDKKTARYWSCKWGWRKKPLNV